MSVTYPDYSNTVFPDSIDTFNYFTDINSTTLPLAQQYTALYEAGNFEGAATFLEENPILKKSYIGAATLNPMVDALKALELFYMQDVQQYLINIIKDKGTFSSTTKYTKFNVVGYTNNGANETYICLITDTPIGTLPTNTDYWRSITLRGAQGIPGIGLTPYGAWNSSTTYPKDALVAYNNALWGAKIQNTNVLPTVTATTTWFKIIDFNADLLFFNDQVTGKSYQMVVENGKIYFQSGGERIDLALKTDINSLQTQISNLSPYIKQTTPPANTNALWIDTASNLIKYHNGTSWVATSAVWG